MSWSMKKQVVLSILSPISADGCAWMRIGEGTEWGNIEAFMRCYLADGYEVRVESNLKSIENWDKKPNMSVIRKMVREAIAAVRKRRNKNTKKR